MPPCRRHSGSAAGSTEIRSACEDNEISHEAKPGDTLYGISQQYRAPFSDVLKANKQFRDPDRIKPGDVVFVPNADPRVI